ncbi:MAG: alpha/beta hydrolase [Acidobacteriota bacterium]|nr:alpha/beta hydrolase [Acidobacteriota bacterium]
MKRLLVLLLCGGLLAACADDANDYGDPSGNTSAPVAEDTKPLWANVPETISPEWGAFFSERGQGRETPMPAPEDLEAWRAVQAANDAAKEAAADEKAAAFGVAYEESEIAGIPVVEVTPSELASTDKIAVYIHGGAYVLNSAKAVIECAMFFAAETGLRVIAVDYTLAPHSKWEETTNEVINVFKALAKQGFTANDIALYGDSAGGGLAAGVTLKMRDLGMEMPAVLVLWSPWADISETGDTYVTLRDAEPYYTYEHVLGPSALAYADAKDHKNPYVSPVYGDFRQGFPPTLIQGGTKELFLSNVVRLYQALDQAGQTVKLDIYEGMPHVFVPSLPETIESQAAIAKVRDWVSEHLLDD